MSFTLDLVINPIVLALAGIIGIIIGYLFLRVRLARIQSKMQKLEMDLLSANQETLEAQRAFVALESQVHEGQDIPVIPMKMSGNSKESTKEKASK
ncbi:MAG TPA: hypothetical protein VGS79_14870 [Puia sp.]|nr:hypothetical protein [Puia sp.]